MTAHHAYKTQRAGGWTRAELLITLYETAIRRIDEALRAGDANEARRHRMRALQVVLEIQAGIDLSQGELPKRTHQLCEFVQHCLLEGEKAKVQSARRVLATLLEGFEGIRDEANRLELSGQIPPVIQDASFIREA